MPKTAKQYADELQGIWESADREGRELTPGDRAHVEQLIESAKSMHRIEQEISEMGGRLGGAFVTATDPNHSFADGGDPGAQFVESSEYMKVKDPASRGQSWSTGRSTAASTC